MSEKEITRRKMMSGAAAITVAATGAVATGAVLPSVVNGSVEGTTSKENHPMWKRALEAKEEELKLPETSKKPSLYDNLGIVQKIEVLLRAGDGVTTAYHSQIRELIPELMKKVSPAVTGTVVDTLERLKADSVIGSSEFNELVGVPV